MFFFKDRWWVFIWRKKKQISCFKFIYMNILDGQISYYQFWWYLRNYSCKRCYVSAPCNILDTIFVEIDDQKHDTMLLIPNHSVVDLVLELFLLSLRWNLFIWWIKIIFKYWNFRSHIWDMLLVQDFVIDSYRVNLV